MEDALFLPKLNEAELRARTLFVDINVVKIIIKNHRAENYRELVTNILKTYEKLDVEGHFK